MYCINPQDEVPIFLIDSQIGRDDEHPEQPFIDGNAFARELLSMDGLGKKSIEVWINSPGGSVIESMAIYGTMLKCKTPVDTVNYGIAYSSAGVLFQGGRKRKMMDYATLMYHEAYSPNSEEERSKFLDIMNESLATMISSRSWKDPEAVKKMMAKETYITAQDAVDSDLCDVVESSDAFNKPRKKAEAHSRWQFANEVLNKILPVNKQNSQMNKADICKVLNLDPNISDDALAAHIAKNKADADNGRSVAGDDKKKEAEDRAAKAEAEAKAAKEALDALNKKVTDEEAARKTATEKEVAENKKKVAKEKILAKCKERGLNFKDEAINKYVELAGIEDKGLEEVINMIEEIPVTKKAPNIINSAALKEGEVGFDIDPKTGGVLNTSKMASYINSQARKNALNRFSGK